MPKKNREFVAQRWERTKEKAAISDDVFTLDGFLERVRSHGFTITAMAFQDAGNLDLERLRYCSLHVYHNGVFTPFCAYYLRKGQGV